MKKKMISAFALILALSAAVRAQEAPLPPPRDGKERRPPPERMGNVDESTN